MSINSMKTCKIKKVDNINIEALHHKHVLTEKEAAVYLGVSRSFLRRGRSEGARSNHRIRPSYLRIGRMIRYLRSDLDNWMQDHVIDCKPLATEAGEKLNDEIHESML